MADKRTQERSDIDALISTVEAVPIEYLAQILIGFPATESEGSTAIVNSALIGQLSRNVDSALAEKLYRSTEIVDNDGPVFWRRMVQRCFPYVTELPFYFVEATGKTSLESKTRQQWNRMWKRAFTVLLNFTQRISFQFKYGIITSKLDDDSPNPLSDIGNRLLTCADLTKKRITRVLQVSERPEDFYFHIKNVIEIYIPFEAQPGTGFKFPEITIQPGRRLTVPRDNGIVWEAKTLRKDSLTDQPVEPEDAIVVVKTIAIPILIPMVPEQPDNNYRIAPNPEPCEVSYTPRKIDDRFVRRGREYFTSTPARNLFAKYIIDMPLAYHTVSVLLTRTLNVSRSFKIAKRAKLTELSNRLDGVLVPESRYWFRLGFYDEFGVFYGMIPRLELRRTGASLVDFHFPQSMTIVAESSSNNLYSYPSNYNFSHQFVFFDENGDSYSSDFYESILHDWMDIKNVLLFSNAITGKKATKIRITDQFNTPFAIITPDNLRDGKIQDLYLPSEIIIKVDSVADDNAPYPSFLDLSGKIGFEFDSEHSFAELDYYQDKYPEFTTPTLISQDRYRIDADAVNLSVRTLQRFIEDYVKWNENDDSREDIETPVIETLDGKRLYDLIDEYKQSSIEEHVALLGLGNTTYVLASH